MIVRNYKDLKEWKQAVKDNGFKSSHNRTSDVNVHYDASDGDSFAGFFNTQPKIGQLRLIEKRKRVEEGNRSVQCRADHHYGE